MKIIFVLITLMFFSTTLHAGSSSGGTPSHPCIIDGKLVHAHLLITECNEIKKKLAEKTASDVEAY
ncbi:hypothetical protein BIZ37_29075 [Photobacterium sp. BZF1]|uniref:hypothetical protein n=1 Tax=Photobacterium sp. BZF1 TaxID=1904457 RepID=UPI0016539B8C|nr:hypothetical protein [Photobacterium sp. BZF1]MBC7006607.1 hypothetical protein [Photobacterium sp. BZF1]